MDKPVNSTSETEGVRGTAKRTLLRALNLACRGTVTSEMHFTVDRECGYSELVAAMHNLRLRDKGGPNPYGHDCEWCGQCWYRAQDEADVALAKALRREVSRENRRSK